MNILTRLRLRAVRGECCSMVDRCDAPAPQGAALRPWLDRMKMASEYGPHARERRSLSKDAKLAPNPPAFHRWPQTGKRWWPTVRNSSDWTRNSPRKGSRRLPLGRRAR